jgi:hypothetical protein
MAPTSTHFVFYTNDIHKASQGQKLRRRPAKGKGQGSGEPGPNNRASLGGETMRGAVWKATFCRVAPFLFLQYIARMLSRVRPRR